MNESDKKDLGKLMKKQLPWPENHDSGEAEASFKRMDVAYGLSIPKHMLERYTLPKDAPDQTPPKIALRFTRS